MIFRVVGCDGEPVGDVQAADVRIINDEKGEEFGTVESVKAVSDVYAPLTGTIEEINDDLIDAPEIINTSPYEDGWMVKIRMANAADADDLMDAEAYQALVAEEG